MESYQVNSYLKLAYSDLSAENYEAAEKSFREIIKYQELSKAWLGLGFAILGKLCQFTNLEQSYLVNQIETIYKCFAESKSLSGESYESVEEQVMNEALRKIKKSYGTIKQIADHRKEYNDNGKINDFALLMLAARRGDFNTSINANNNLVNTQKQFDFQTTQIKHLISRLSYAVNILVDDVNEKKEVFNNVVTQLKQEAEWYILPEVQKKQILDQRTPKLPLSQQAVQTNKTKSEIKWFWALIVLLVVAYFIYQLIQ